MPEPCGACSRPDLIAPHYARGAGAPTLAGRTTPLDAHPTINDEGMRRTALTNLIETKPDTGPTGLPCYARRPRPVAITITRPTSLPGVFRAAARLLSANGHYQGDYCPDPFDHVTRTPHASRPLSIVAALRCAVSGSPHRTTTLSELAISTLAHRLEVDGELGPFEETEYRCEMHVANWGDAEGRTTESAVAVLYAAADAVEVTA